MKKSAIVFRITHPLAMLAVLAWLGVAPLSPAHAGGISVSTVNGQTTVRYNGKEVFSGPSKGRVRGYSSNVNGEEFAAAFDGDAVLWENTPGAAQKVQRNPGIVLPQGMPNFHEQFNFNVKPGEPRVPAFPEGFNFNFQGFNPGRHQWGGTFLTSSTSISTRTINGQTTVTVGTNVVFSGQTSGSVSVKTEVRDGVPRILVQDGDKVIFDSVNPVDEFASDNNPGTKLPGGLLSPDGTVIPGEVVSSDDSQLLLHRLGGKEEMVSLGKIAVVLFRPFPEAKRNALIRPERGLLLRTGDYVEGELKSIRDGKVEISSVLFGLKSYDTTKEAVALVLQKLAPEFISQKKDNSQPQAAR